MRGFLGRLLAAALLLAPLPATADTALKALLNGDDARGWAGVGRIDFGGQSFCTGSLIAENLVLTAAHCLFDPGSGRRYEASEITFLAGWRNGQAAAYRGVRRAVSHPDYEGQDDRALKVAHDLALLELDQPVRTSAVTPFAVQARPRKGAEVGVVSYAFDRADSPSLQELCHVLARQDGVLVLSCDIDFGSSGAPVFVIQDGVPQIVSVISAKADAQGRKVALGTDLEQPLADLRTLLASADSFGHSTVPSVRRVTQDGGRGDSGAKFLRP